MKRVRKGHFLNVLICLCIFVGLLIAERYALKSLFSTYPHVEEVKAEHIQRPIVEPINTIVVEQGTVCEEVTEFSYEEAQLLMVIAQAEAGNQGVDGMYFVMSVICNRAQSEEFPNSIYDVVFQPNQFTTVTDGTYERVSLSPECHEALARLESKGAQPYIIAFETTNSNVLDKWFEYAYTHKDHKFYTFKEG